MKAIERYFPVVLFILLHKAFLTLSLLEILKCIHSNETRIKQFFPVVLFTSSSDYEILPTISTFFFQFE